MRSIVVSEPGGPEALQLVHVPPSAPAPGEVRIRIAAAGVNPVDVVTRRGVFHDLGWLPRDRPVGIGWDLAGQVDAVGPGVDGFAIGTRVAALRGQLDAGIGAYADQLTLPAAAVAALPGSLDTHGAATLPLNALTADQALDMLGLPADAELLVTGAAGGVGGFAVPLAVRRGWRVTALARASDRAFLDAAGAHRVVQDLSGSAARFDGVFDTATLGTPALAAVRDGGVYIGVTPYDVPPAQRGVRSEAVKVQPDGGRLARLLRLTADGVLAVRIAGTLPLEQAAEAHRRFEQGSHRGRWLLVI